VRARTSPEAIVRDEASEDEENGVSLSVDAAAAADDDDGDVPSRSRYNLVSSNSESFGEGGSDTESDMDDSGKLVSDVGSDGADGEKAISLLSSSDSDDGGFGTPRRPIFRSSSRSV
jgi:hypothetical protein